MKSLWHRFSLSDPSPIPLVWLILGSAFSTALLGFRIYLSGSYQYLFLGWNLFLAWIPLGITWLLVQKKRSNWVVIPALACWLLFLPNAPYILTDLYHLKIRHGVPHWFDLTLLLAFAWNGLILGFASVRIVEQSILSQIRHWHSLFLGLIWFAVAYGVYLGRYQRWNSWDLMTQPGDLLSAVVAPLIHPAAHPRAIGFTIAFGAFLWATYLMFRANQNQVKAP